MPEGIYRTNDPHIVHEAIDGEVVIVNLESGTYYSTESIGAVIWQLVTRGLPAAAIVDRLCAAYPRSRDGIEHDVPVMLTALRDEGLIVPGSAGGAPPAGGWEDPVLPAAYATPEVSKYVDMQNLLLLDPIHEVGEDAGWPAPKEPDGP